MKQGHFHLHANAVARTKGHSAVAAAAYQSGQSLKQDQQLQCNVGLDHRKDLNKGRVTEALRAELAQHGIALSDTAAAQKEGRREWHIHDGDDMYTVREVEKKVRDKVTKKRTTESRTLDVYGYRVHSYVTREDVKETWIQAGENAPEWVRAMAEKGRAVEKKDREALWNAAEKADVKRDARPARRFQVALVRALSYEQNRELLRQYVDEQFTSRGVIADVAIHQKAASDGNLNTHAHILITTREINANGEFSDNKPDYWQRKSRVSEWRRAWADKVNTALEEDGSNVRVSPLSYKERGLDIVPGEHVGPNEYNRSKRGEKSQKAERNEQIEAQNAQKDKYWKALGDRMSARYPEYTVQDQEAYYQKLERQQSAARATYEPDEKTLDAGAKRIAASEKKAEANRETYAARITIKRFWGLGSTTTETFSPGMANLPRKVRDHLDKTTFREPPEDVRRRIDAYHQRTFAGFVGSEQSGGSPRRAMEQLQRIAKAARDRAAEAGHHVRERFSGWRGRVDRSKEDRER